MIYMHVSSFVHTIPTFGGEKPQRLPRSGNYEKPSTNNGPILCSPVLPCVPLCSLLFPCVPLCSLCCPVFPCVSPCSPVYPCVGVPRNMRSSICQWKTISETCVLLLPVLGNMREPPHRSPLPPVASNFIPIIRRSTTPSRGGGSTFAPKSPAAAPQQNSFSFKLTIWMGGAQIEN